jgi:cation transporter-like permease
VPRRLAVVVALVVFAVCLLAGMMAENTFVETVRRALLAMFATLVIGLIIGVMAQRMLDENAKQLENGPEKSPTKVETPDR